jgi:hypothetical protein
MTVQLKLTVEQISTAIMLLDRQERQELTQRLPLIIGVEPAQQDDFGWLRLAESSFAFWDDEAEDIYSDLAPAGNTTPE